MATTYDKASLVMIPSGYKDDKLYSVKPTDGSGDFTFSRDGAGASPATRVNASGLIEKGRENVLLQSNQFDTTWSISNTSVTSGQSGYDGSNDAWLLEKSAANAFLFQVTTFANVQSISIYAKAGSLNWININVGGSTYGGYFDLANGVTGSNIGSPIATKITDVGGGWYRCEAAGIYSGTTSFRIYPADANGVTSGTSGNIYIQDAQVELGLVATDVIETTTAPVSAGLLGDMPRLDYSGGATCPSLLLEPSRVNVITSSEHLGSYSVSNVSVSYNNATSPEGVQNATLVTGDAGTLTKVVNFNPASNGAYTISVFAKYNTHQWIQLGMGGVATYANFDIQNGVVGGTNGTSDIEDYGNGWYRCSVQTTTGTPLSHYIGMVNGSSSARLSTSSSTGSFWAYGMQSEIGSYPTSYIPTYGSASTRASEPNAVDKVDLITDGFFSSTELTWFMDVNLYERDAGTTVAPRLISSSNSQVFIGFNTGAVGTFFSIRHKDGTTALNTSSISFDENGQRIKVLIKISGTTGKAFINGSSVGSFTTLAASNYDVFDNTDNNAYNFKQLLMFQTALTDAECIALTTL